MGYLPWWYNFMLPRLRAAYPGVAPWEWDAHPEWHQRVMAGLLAEMQGQQIRAEYERQLADEE